MTAVLYHSSCPDGWTAAWVAHHALDARGDTPELIAVSYGAPPPDLDGHDHAYIVDFSYPHDVLVDLAEKGLWVMVLDHHQTAVDQLTPHLHGAPYTTVLDMDRSGAGITWDYFHPGFDRPPVVDYVEDRDLWRFKLPASKAISACIGCQPHTIETWDDLAEMSIGHMSDLGEGALLHLDAYVRAAVSHGYWCEMGGRRFPIANVTSEGRSDVAAGLIDAFDTDMAGYYFRDGTGLWQYGFRSRKGTTVHDFAAGFGGGGHPQASGCRSPELLHTRAS